LGWLSAQCDAREKGQQEADPQGRQADLPQRHEGRVLTMSKLIQRIRRYRWCKQMGIRHPWKASGDKKFIRGWF